MSGLFGWGGPIRLGVVGLGKIARDQHLPALRADRRFRLVAAADPSATLDGLKVYPSLEAMLAGERRLDAVALCTPAEVRTALAETALAAGKHVLLEKPPCATLSEAERLASRIAVKGPTLFAAWHSRFAAGVEPARAWLADHAPASVEVTWKEDARIWHPGQAWLWKAGGFGVFDPGINALSVLTRILPGALTLKTADLAFPSNCETPIAADLTLALGAGVPVSAAFDFRQSPPEIWEIRVTALDGQVLHMTRGGAEANVEGRPLVRHASREYPGVYAHFADLIAKGRSDMDLSPLRLTADAFLVGRRRQIEPFTDERRA